jgi:hypothetical protein
VHRYLDRVVAATTHDPTIADSFVQVVGLLTRSTSLFTPRVLVAAARARPNDKSTLPSSVPPARPPTSAAANGEPPRRNLRATFRARGHVGAAAAIDERVRASGVGAG